MSTRIQFPEVSEAIRKAAKEFAYESQCPVMIRPEQNAMFTLTKDQHYWFLRANAAGKTVTSDRDGNGNFWKASFHVVTTRTGVAFYYENMAKNKFVIVPVGDSNDRIEPKFGEMKAIPVEVVESDDELVSVP